MDTAALESLKYSHSVLRNVLPSSLASATHEMAAFFRQEQAIKNTFICTKHPELGYRAFPNREIFILREANSSAQLPMTINLAHQLHEICLSCLQFIAAELHLSADYLLDLVEKKAIPDSGVGSSLLRVARYNPSCQLDEIACAPHEDLGLLTLVCYTGVPALEIYDFLNNTDWLDIERDQCQNDIIVMAGESLSYLSNAYYLAATHRVRQVKEERLALIYHLRFKPDAILDSKLLQTEITGAFAKPFQQTAADFMQREMSARISVNGSY